MKKYTKEELQKILELHLCWTKGEEGGECADLRGADLGGADLGGADLRGADLRDAYLRDADLGGADLRGADLRGADLRGAYLGGADLRDAYLRDADLRGADLRGAYLGDADLGGMRIDTDTIPIVEGIDKRVLDLVEAGSGKLEMEKWHSCETTHCRAGWAIHFAGQKGYELERAVGPSCAGALIYAASCPTLPVPNFYATNEEALADMRERAGKGC